MSKKMGRPKLPKAKLRRILMQARLSPEENKVIIQAIRRSKDGKSEWIRKALLSVAQNDNPVA